MIDRLRHTGERFFLSPVCLVPNGRSHLGHITGPLLRMDVARRHLLRAGATVVAVNTSDTHESHVLVQAFHEGTTPEALARRYHKEIGEDLRALSIEWDDFIDPLDERWNGVYRSVVSDLLRRIVDGGGTRVRSVEVPMLAGEDDADLAELRPRVGEPVVSGWLRGRCPECAEQLVGFFCEQCGGCFEPAEVLSPTPAHFSGSLVFASRKSLYLKSPVEAAELLTSLSQRGVTPHFRGIAEGHLGRVGAWVRLTAPSRWGIPAQHPDVASDEVIWSYSALLIGCHILAGERYAEITGDVNPFRRDSGVTCAISFGVDNTVPYLVYAQTCLLAQSLYKPVDVFLTNHFALLDGQKFSTSRRHVIWGGDLVGRAGAHPDLARLLLCVENPQFARVDFSTSTFAVDHACLARRLENCVARVREHVAEESVAHDLEPAVRQRLISQLSCQDQHLSFAAFDLAAAARVVFDWLDAADDLRRDAASALTWLYGLAVLSAPFMPGIARRIWEDVGQEGTPVLEGLLERRVRLRSSSALQELELVGDVQLASYESWVNESPAIAGERCQSWR